MKLLFYTLLLFFSGKVVAQNISGLYSGKLINDSTQRVQHFELALSEYRDKITGYSYTTFVVNDTFYYSIKRVKGTKQDGNLIVEDVKMLANNFPGSPAKGVRQTTIFPLNRQDTVRLLRGAWKTTKTKEYYSLQGGVDMKRDADSAHSALIHHLAELKIIDNPASAVTATKNKITSGSTNKSSSHISATTVLPVGERAINIIQALDVYSDSLVLYFYDNGIVDGDTISVFLNGQKIISKTRLSAVAAKKTIYTHQSDDGVLQLMLMAENLGNIPPNTGLLLIQDGAEKHEIRFSADMQTNAAITLRKRKQ